MVAFHTPPAGDQAHNPDMYPDWESNQQPFGLQAGTQSTEPYQPELKLLIGSAIRQGKEKKRYTDWKKSNR